MEVLRQWLTDAGVGDLAQHLVLFPLFAAFAAWTVAGAIRVVLWRLTEPPLRRKLFRWAKWSCALGGFALLGHMWSSGLGEGAPLFASLGRADAERFQALVRGAILTAVATAVLVVLLRFLRHVTGVARTRVRTWEEAAEQVRFRGVDLVRRDRVAETVLGAVRIARVLLILLILYLYVPLVLTFFPATAAYGDRLLRFIGTPMVEVALGILRWLPNLFTIAVIAAAAYLFLRLLRILRFAVKRGDLTIGGFEPDWADATYSVLRLVTVLFALMFAFPYLPGSGSQFFEGFALFLGALVTLGSGSAIGNLLSGLVLTYTSAFRVGDRVKIGETEGKVFARTLIVTRIRTLRNEEVTIPNGVVLRDQVVNFSEAANRGELAVVVAAGLGYDLPWRRARDMLLEAATRTPGILRDPAPRVLPRGFGNFGVNYELHARIREADSMVAIEATLRENVMDVFDAAGVEIATPDMLAVRRDAREGADAEPAS